MYLLALVLPPVAVLIAGKPFQAFLNLFLLALGYVPGAIHAILVVREYKEDKKIERLVKVGSAIQNQRNQK